MLITGIEPRDKGLFALFVEGEYALMLSDELIVRNRLRVGMELSCEALNDLNVQAQERKARERAFYLIGHRAHSRKELVDKLTRSVSDEIAEQTADKMEELGLIDDADYARRLAHDLVVLKKYGRIRVRQALYLKGIDRDIIDEVLDQFFEDEDEEYARLCQIIERKYLRYLGDRKGRDRTVNALRRLGYSFSLIRTALEEYDDFDEDFDE